MINRKFSLLAALVVVVASAVAGKALGPSSVAPKAYAIAPRGRYIVIEFPSLAVAKEFEASPEYLKIAPLRQRASRGRVFLVEGAPQP